VVATGMVEASRWALIIAMVGLGMKASFKELSTVGWKPIALLLAETILLAAGVALWLHLAR
ncbi:MAG: putative sulfate exporter family transporter, partial [Proteobacteria bacterium]